MLGRDVRFHLGPGTSLTLDDGVQLGDGCRFHLAPGAAASIGAGSVLGERCAVSLQAGATIGARCVLGDEVVLTDFEPVADDPETPLREVALDAAPITVGDGARIGPSAALLLGARVPPGGTVGAHANVSR